MSEGEHCVIRVVWHFGAVYIGESVHFVEGILNTRVIGKGGYRHVQISSKWDLENHFLCCIMVKNTEES